MSESESKPSLSPDDAKAIDGPFKVNRLRRVREFFASMLFVLMFWKRRK